jgi:hypothetical protein
MRRIEMANHYVKYRCKNCGRNLTGRKPYEHRRPRSLSTEEMIEQLEWNLREQYADYPEEYIEGVVSQVKNYAPDVIKGAGAGAAMGAPGGIYGAAIGAVLGGLAAGIQHSQSSKKGQGTQQAVASKPQHSNLNAKPDPTTVLKARRNGQQRLGTAQATTFDKPDSSTPSEPVKSLSPELTNQIINIVSSILATQAAKEKQQKDNSSKEESYPFTEYLDDSFSSYGEDYYESDPFSEYYHDEVAFDEDFYDDENWEINYDR